VVALFLANRMFQLPLALFGIAMGQVALSSLSHHAAREDMRGFRDTISFALRNVFFFTVPASAGLMICAFPIIKILFERGNFTVSATTMTARVLMFYAIGLVAYGSMQTLVAAFYAMKDTRTPLKVTSLALVINILLNLMLMVPLRAAGLALATALSGFVSFALLFVLLKRKVGQFMYKAEAVFALKLFAAVLLMSIVSYALVNALSWTGGMAGVVNLAILIVCSGAVYMAACYILRVEELRSALRWIGRR